MKVPKVGADGQTLIKFDVFGVASLLLHGHVSDDDRIESVVHGKLFYGQNLGMVSRSDLKLD